MRKEKCSAGEKCEEKVALGGQGPGQVPRAAQGRAAAAVGLGTGWKLPDVIHKSSAKLTAHTQLKNVSKQ